MIKVSKLRMAGFLKYFNCKFIKAEKDIENNQRYNFYFDSDDERTMKFLEIYRTGKKGKEKGKEHILPKFEESHYTFTTNGRKKIVIIRNQVLQGFLIVLGGMRPVDLVGDNGEVMIFRDNEKIKYLIELFYKPIEDETLKRKEKVK